MHELVNKVRLRTGEELAITKVECPAGPYEGPLGIAYAHKNDVQRRDIAQRLRGRYAEQAQDRFFVGEIDGRIVSRMWYTLPRDGMDVGVFGHVFTNPEHRGKGVASLLMDACAGLDSKKPIAYGATSTLAAATRTWSRPYIAVDESP